jgi:hypothetical protein
MLSIYALLHLLSVAPVPDEEAVKHFIFNILGIAQESYWEFMYRKLPTKNW